MQERPPIHAYEGDKQYVRITRKTGLYGSEAVCVLHTGKGLGTFNAYYDARTLANALCEYLESQRPPEPDDAA